MFASPVAKGNSPRYRSSTVEAQQKKETIDAAAQTRQSSDSSAVIAPLSSLPVPSHNPNIQGSPAHAPSIDPTRAEPRKGLANVPVFSAFERGPDNHSGFPARRMVIQAKLTVGSVDDPLEAEADRVAEQVVRSPSPSLSVSCAPPQINRKWSAQAERSSASAEAPAAVHNVLASPGQPLDTATRAFIEPRFGREFSNVRIHTDAVAANSADAIRARAYTAGNHLVFAAGQYAPGSTEGRTLLAHELTHVVQQNGAAVAVQRSPKKDDDESTPSRPSDAKVTQKVEGNRIIQNERLDRGRDHALLIRIIDLTVPITPHVSVRLYRGQELPSLRGNKTEINWTDVTNQAQGDGPLSVDWNMPSADEGDPKKQLEKDKELAAQHPNPVLSLFVPVSNAYAKDRSSEIHDPQIRSQYGVDRQGIEAGTNVSRAGAAVGVGVAVAGTAALELAPAAAAAAGAADLGPGAAYAARYVYLNAPSLYASAVMYGGAVMTGAALAQHVQKVRSKGFDLSDIPQLAEDLLPAVSGYLEAQSFTTSPRSAKPAGTGGGGNSGDPVEPDLVILRPAKYDPQTKRISASVTKPGSGQTFDADFDPVTGNGQITERRSRQVVGIISNGEIRRPAAAALAASSPAADDHPAAPAAPKAKPAAAPSPSAAQGPASKPAQAPAAPVTKNDIGNKDISHDAGNPSQKLLDKKEPSITSDVDPRSAKLAARDKTEAKSVYEVKKESKDPSDQAEVRIAERFAQDGHKIHFNADDRHGDLTVDGVATDVKHLTKNNSIPSAIQRGLTQGEQVILDGTTVNLTKQDTAAGIRELETEIAKHPGKFRNLRTIYIMEGDGTIYIYHTAKSDAAPLKVKQQ